MTDQIDHRLRGLKDPDNATPPFEAVLARPPRRLRRGLVAAMALLTVTAAGAGWWSEQNGLDTGQYALAEIPSTDWLLDAPDAGVVEPDPGALP